MARSAGNAVDVGASSVILPRTVDHTTEIPDASVMFSGTYSRSGTDLLIRGEADEGYTVPGFFSDEGQQGLRSPGGAELSFDTVSALAGSRTPGQIAQTGNIDTANAIGQVETLTGPATALRTDGTTVPLSPGTPVYQGDVVSTGDGAALGIGFVDGTVFSLSENARMVLDEMVYDPSGSDNSMLFSLVQGGFVFVAGEIAPTGDMRVQTPVATLGIRGTSPTVFIAEDGVVTFSIIRDPGPDGKIGSYLLYDEAGRVIGSVQDVSTKLILASSVSPVVTVQKTQEDFLKDREFEEQAYSTFETMRSRTTPGTNPNGRDGGEAPTEDGVQEKQGELFDAPFEGGKAFRVALDPERPQDELIFGSEFDDNFIKGGKGDDVIFGGEFSDDFLSGGRGDDLIIGGVFGTAILSGGPGDDVLIGSEFGDSILSGGPGNDILLGNNGDDALFGGPGNDIANGGRGSDLIEGGDGDDDIAGDRGRDILVGGAGSDRFEYAPSDTDTDLIVDYEAADFLDIDTLLDGSFSLPVASDYVAAVDVGGAAAFAVDGDGAGTAESFEIIALLAGLGTGDVISYTIDGADTLTTVVVA